MALELLGARDLDLVAHPFACYCACVWCSWWVDQPLGHAVGAVCHIMVVNFNNINISWQPRRASGRGKKKAQNTRTPPLLVLYVLGKGVK